MTSSTRPTRKKAVSSNGSESTEPQIREEQILEAAARLFKERGFAGTSFLDIAQAIGVSRTAVYHYFSTKEQLFYRLSERALSKLPAVFEEIIDSDLSPREKMRSVLRVYLKGMMEDGASLWLVLTEAERHLSPHQYRRLYRVVRQNDAILTKIYRDGVAAGQFAGLHPKIAVFILAGACNWLSRWYDPEGEVDPETIIDTFLRLVEHGYLSTDSTAT